jgi:hypothetical protein
MENIAIHTMNQLNGKNFAKVITRMPRPMKKRLAKMKFDRDGDFTQPNKQETIMCAALDEYLKKFGY